MMREMMVVRMPGLVMKAETSRVNQLGLPTLLVMEEKRIGRELSEGLRMLLQGLPAVKNQMRPISALQGQQRESQQRLCPACWSLPQEIHSSPFKAILTKSNPSQGNYCQNVKGMHLIMF